MLPGVVGGWGTGAMELVHVCGDPREVGRGGDLVVKEGVLEKGELVRGGRGLI